MLHEKYRHHSRRCLLFWAELRRTVSVYVYGTRFCRNSDVLRVTIFGLKMEQSRTARNSGRFSRFELCKAFSCLKIEILFPAYVLRPLSLATLSMATTPHLERFRYVIYILPSAYNGNGRKLPKISQRREYEVVTVAVT